MAGKAANVRDNIKNQDKKEGKELLEKCSLGHMML